MFSQGPFLEGSVLLYGVELLDTKFNNFINIRKCGLQVNTSSIFYETGQKIINAREKANMRLTGQTSKVGCFDVLHSVLERSVNRL